MTFMPFYINCAKRTSGAKVLASSTADATFFVDNRDFKGFRITGIGQHHGYCIRRAVDSTVATAFPIGQRNTILFYPNGMPHLDGGFLRFGYFKNGSCRTHFRTLDAFRTAISAFIGRFRLCIKVSNPVEGRNTPFGQTDTHNWQPVQ